VTYNPHVSDVLRLVYFHGCLPFDRNRITVETLIKFFDSGSQNVR